MIKKEQNQFLDKLVEAAKAQQELEELKPIGEDEVIAAYALYSNGVRNIGEIPTLADENGKPMNLAQAIKKIRNM